MSYLAAIVLAAALTLSVLHTAPPTISAQPATAVSAEAQLATAHSATLSGQLPSDGGIALTVFSGDTLQVLLESAADQGCHLTSAWATSHGKFVGYIAGAPTIANANFTASFPDGFQQPTPLVIACASPTSTLIAESTWRYTVRAGDTVASVAAQLQVSADTLRVVNNLPDAHHLIAGQRLRLPGANGMIRIGTTVQGRPLEVSCKGIGSRIALVIGGIHTGPYEEVTADLAQQLMEQAWLGRIHIPEGVRLCIVPVANPDGIPANTRTNANGVDLNRNWPGDTWQAQAYHPEDGAVSGGTRPLSEPEVRALHDYIIEITPDIVIAYHCCGEVVEGNSLPAARTHAQLYAEAAGFTHIDEWLLYHLTGQLIDALEDRNIPAIDVELARPDTTNLATHTTAIAAILAHLGD